MLIVIVIIGILAAALIPRLTGIQARARDTSRINNIQQIANALEIYHLDYGTYPLEPIVNNYNFSSHPPADIHDGIC